MNFLSFQFAIFFLIVLLGLAIWPNERIKKFWLVLLSYVFYAFFDLKYLLLLFFITIWNYYWGRNILKNKNKYFLAIGIFGNIIALSFFKYFNFFVESINRIWNEDITLQVIMPIGLSFYIFQAISFLVDSYRKKINVQYNFIDVALYIAFFPQIISGPIVKASEFFVLLENRKKLTCTRAQLALQRFTVGAFEKLVIADRLAVAVDSVYAAPLAYSGLSLFWASISYTLQIYFDFAGYSNMAIAIAYILGFDYPENFNMPYLARNPAEFWNRWHISLSSYLREYVYIPLGGNRKGKTRTYTNLMITMLISGIWHGSTINFLIWGGFHGIASVVHKMFLSYRKSQEERCKSKILDVICIIVNFCWVSLLWIPFRAGDLKSTYDILTRIFMRAQGITYVYSYTIIFLIGLIIVQIISAVKYNRNNIQPVDLSKFSGKLIYCCLLIGTLLFAYFGNGAFIYGQF